ncbi:hypothetical protein ACQUY5_18645 [Bacillus cereus]|uniref:hypothetical protein n=1 Tax=Bacillus cereus TaxID=1396 RepID=UPI003D18137F
MNITMLYTFVSLILVGSWVIVLLNYLLLMWVKYQNKKIVMEEEEDGNKDYELMDVAKNKKVLQFAVMMLVIVTVAYTFTDSFEYAKGVVSNYFNE